MDKNTKEEIIEKYLSGISANQICIEKSINISSVMYLLRKNNIPIRSISENVNNYYTKKKNCIINFDEELNDILLGNLLGDGSIRLSMANCIYTHTDKHLEYVEWIKDIFKKYNVNGNISKTNNNCYSYRSETCEQFNKYYEMFYKEKRIVPNNILLNKIILRQWYISDGHLKYNGYSHAIEIAKTPYNDILMKQLKNIFGDNCSYHLDNKNGYGKYYLPVAYTNSFFNYIGDCPSPCYNYKWNK